MDNDTSLTITLDTDGVSAQFDIKDRLSAAEVDVLIRDLVGMRREMQPAISNGPPSNYAKNVFSEQDDPHLELRKLSGGRVRLKLFTPGLGWMLLDLSAESTAALRDYLTLVFPAEEGGRSLQISTCAGDTSKAQ